MAGYNNTITDINGKVGIGKGSTEPGAKLDVNGGGRFNTATGSTPFYITRNGANDQALKIYVDDAAAVFESIQDETADGYGSFIFNMDAGVTEPFYDIRKNNSTIMRVDGDGKVGIGTTNPGYKLQVGDTGAGDGNIAMKANGSGADAGAKLTFNMDVGGGNANSYIAQIVPISYDSLSSGTHSSLNFKVGTWNNNADAGVSRMTILSNGRVGIGTTDPGNPLHIVGNTAKLQGSGSGYTAWFITNSGTGNAGNYYDAINGDTAGGDYGFVGQTNDGYMSYDIGTQSPMPYHVFTGGNVGINTTDPGAKLDVSQTTTGIGAIIGNTTHNSQLQIYTAAAGKNSEIWFGDADSDNVGAIDYDHNTNEMAFSTNGSQKVVIESGGDFGINTTNPSYKLDVGGDARSTHFRDGTKGGGITSTTAGWYKIASWDGGVRGGSEIKLSTTGGSFTPITWIIRCYKNWSYDATLKLEQYGYSNTYFTKARIVRDTTTNVLYVEVYQPGTTALNFNMYQTSLMGYDANVAIITGTLPVGTPAADASVRAELPFVAGGTSVEALVIGNSGNTGPYLPLAGGTLTGALNVNARLDVTNGEGKFIVDSKTHNLTNAFTTCLSVSLNSHTGCYVTLTCFGDWGSHSAAAYRGEFFLQNGANGYAEPGIILRQDDNTSNGADQIVCQIVDPTGTGNPKNFEIQIRTTATTGTTSFQGQLTYTVQGKFNSIT